MNWLIYVIRTNPTPLGYRTGRPYIMEYINRFYKTNRLISHSLSNATYINLEVSGIESCGIKEI
jgi:hypothetical protein